jgi:hypothetical protein
VTQALIAGRTGVGLLHDDTAAEAQRRGEVALLFECPAYARVPFAQLATRAQDPVLTAATALVRAAFGELAVP